MEGREWEPTGGGVDGAERVPAEALIGEVGREREVAGGVAERVPFD